MTLKKNTNFITSCKNADILSSVSFRHFRTRHHRWMSEVGIFILRLGKSSKVLPWNVHVLGVVVEEGGAVGVGDGGIGVLLAVSIGGHGEGIVEKGSQDWISSVWISVNGHGVAVVCGDNDQSVLIVGLAQSSL